MVQRRAARFVKGRYGMYESVTQMLEELTWVPLSKRRENACLILFYKIINNLAMVPHSCLEKADGRKLRETAYFALVRSFLEYSATVWHPHQKYNSDKLEMVQRRAARFVKGRYGMYESVTQMLEELTWVPLSKRRENARLILFYKIINNLAMVPHSCLEKADGRTRKNHNLKFRHIGYNVDPYGQSFFPKCISAWNGLAQEIAEANTLDLFKSKLAH